MIPDLMKAGTGKFSEYVAGVSVLGMKDTDTGFVLNALHVCNDMLRM